jgi:hypothetical protein
VFDDLTVEVWIDVGGVATLLASDALSGCLNASDVITINLTALGVVHSFSTVGDTEVKFYIKIAGSGEWDRDLLSENVINWEVNYNQVNRHILLSGTEYFDATTSKVSMINETGSRILEAITNDNFRLLSDYYGRTDSRPYVAPSGEDGVGSLRVLTVGLLLRQFLSGKLTMSFKDFFEGLNAIDNVGIGLEDDGDRSGYQVIRMEDARYFYNETVLFQLDKIPLVEIEVNQDEHFSLVEIGYNKWEAEEYTGLDEFATKREYRTTLSSVTNTLSKLSNLIASGYAIELTRRKTYLVSSKEDWRFDNDTFIICVDRGGSGAIVVEQGNITGDVNIIDASTAYNFRISPVRNAMRWLKTALQSYRDVTDADAKLIYTDGNGNILATGLMTGAGVIEAAVVAENSDLNKDSLGDPADAYPIYVPELWSFDFPMSLTQYNLAKASATNVIQGRFGQDAAFLDFYIREIVYRPNQGLARFRLLPKSIVPIDPCLIYILQTRGTGSNVIGSALFAGAELSNLFVFVNGELMKYNDANPANNEITSFDSATGYITLNAPVASGRQISIFHLPETECVSCIHRFEGRGSGSTTKTLTGYGSTSLAMMFCFYNGQLMKYNDAVAGNNELVSYVGGTEVLTFAGATNPNRELRVFGILNCGCSSTYSNRGDGTNNPNVSVGVGTLANVFVFYNGNLLKYNDSDTANNEITSYDSGVPEVTLNFTTNANREVRTFKLGNC